MAERELTIRIAVDNTGAVRVLSGLGEDFSKAGKQIEGSLSSSDKAMASLVASSGKAGEQAQDLAAKLGGVHSQLSAVEALASVGSLAASFALAAAGAATLFGLVKNLAEEGIRYNATLEQQQIGLASIIAATNTVTDAQGNALTGIQEFAAAESLAADLMKQIQIDAVETTATTEQLVAAFQAALGPLSAAGLSLDQARQATVLITQAAGALGLPMAQVAQEVRAIAEGTIDQNARLANALQITAAEVREAKSLGKLFELIVGETEAFAIAGERVGQSFSGLASSIADVSRIILGKVFSGPFEELKEVLGGVFDALKNVNNALGENTEKTRLAAEAARQLQEAAAPGFFTQVAQLALVAAKAIGSEFVQGLRLAWQGTKDLLALLEDFISIAGNIIGLGSLWTFFVAGAKAILEGKNAFQAMSEAGQAAALSIKQSSQDIIDRLSSMDRSVNLFAVGLSKLPDLSTVTWRQAKDGASLAEFAFVSLAQRTQEYGTEADIAGEKGRLLKEALEDTAKAAAQFDTQLARITGNTQLFVQTQQKQIDAEAQKKIEASSKSAEAIEQIEKERALKTAQTYIESTQILIANEQKKLQAVLSSSRAAEQVSQAEVTARKAVVGASLEQIRLDQERAKESVDGSSQIVALQTKEVQAKRELAQLDAQSSQIAVSGLQQRIGAENALLGTLGNLISLEQQRGAGDKVAQANLALLGQAQQQLTSSRDADIAALTQQQGTQAAAAKNMTTAAQQAARDIGRAFIDQLEAQQQFSERSFAFFEAQQQTEIAVFDARATALQASTGLMQTELGLIRARGGTLEEQEVVIRKLIEAERELAQLQLQTAQANEEKAVQRLISLDADLGKAAALILQAEAQGAAVDQLKQKYDALRQQQEQAQGAVIRAQADTTAATIAVEEAALRGKQALLDLQNQAAETALVTRNDLIDAFDEIGRGILQGTQDIGETITDLFGKIGVDAFSQLVAGKKSNLDDVLIGNINQLVGLPNGGIIGAIMGQGGSAAGSLLGQGILGGFKGLASNLGPILTDLVYGDILNIFAQLPGDIGNLFAEGVAGIGNLVGSLFPSLGAQIANFAPLLANPIVGAIVLAVSSIPLIMSFFNQPGRIELEKKGAEDFFESVFTDLNFKIFDEADVARATSTFKELVPAVEALGTAFSLNLDDATQGTIVRFNQFLANLEAMGIGRS